MSFERIVHCVRLVFHRKGLRARVVECNVDIAAIVRVLVSVNVVLVNERRDLDPARLAPVDYVLAALFTTPMYLLWLSDE